MSTLPVSEAPRSPENMPFVAPCRTLGLSAPLRWLRLGWADLIRAPRLSLTYGAVLMTLSMVIAALTRRLALLRCTSDSPPDSCSSDRRWRLAYIPSAGSSAKGSSR